MNNKIKEPIFKSGLFYALDKSTVQSAIEKKNKTLNILLKKRHEEDKEPVIIKRGNIFPNENALRRNPNEILIFDIIVDNEIVGNFRGFLYPNETLNGKVTWRIDLQSALEKDVLNGFYKKHSDYGIEFYGYWTDAEGTEGFFAELWNDRPTKKKIIKKVKKKVRKTKSKKEK